MKGLSKGLAVLALGVCLIGCGGEEKKNTAALKPGQMYVMTEKGLEPVLRMRDRNGNDLVAGKEYVMTPAGLEPVQFLRDHKGNRVQVGNDYMMTPDGLK
ncbi:MAG: hypothetical protein ACLGPL_01565, partial [Acidobacteriota bacterium]